MLLNLVYVTACKVEPSNALKLIEFPKIQIGWICRILATFFKCDYSHFRCLEFYQLCTLQYYGTAMTSVLQYPSVTLQVHLKEKQVLIFEQTP